MELTYTMFLIVCPLVFLAGFVDAIGGGGGLITSNAQTTGVSRWKANSKPTFSRIGKRSLEGTEIPPALAGWFFISIPAYLIAGLPAHMAVGMNKLSSGLGTFVSTYRYCKNKYIDYRLAVIGVITALVGGSLGARCTLFVNDVVFEVLLLILLLPFAMYILLKKNPEPK